MNLNQHFDHSSLHLLIRPILRTCLTLENNNWCVTWEKKTLCHIWTVKVKMSVHIHAVWSGHSLFVNIYYSIYWFCKRTMKASISLRECVGWSGPSLSANCIRTLFVRCASYKTLSMSYILWYCERVCCSLVLAVWDLNLKIRHPYSLLEWIQNYNYLYMWNQRV